MKKLHWVFVVLLVLASVAGPKAQKVQASPPCDYMGGGSLVKNFVTPMTLPSPTTMMATSTDMYVEVTYFTPGSPGVWVYYYRSDNTLIDKVLLTSSRPRFTFMYPIWDCTYLKLVTGSTSGNQASGEMWIYY